MAKSIRIFEMAEEQALSKEQQLWKATTDGDLEKVSLLASDKTVDVNWVGGGPSRHLLASCL